MSVNCLFCKIVKGEIPSQKIFDNEHVTGFVDIHPQAKIHMLFVHKTHTADINEMSKDSISIAEVFQAIASYTKENGMTEKGFRVVTNLGADAGQTVFHTHFHLVGGEPLGRFGKR
jgi:histidine triad (HIT) family protein